MGKARIKCERIDQKMNKEMTSKFFEALTDLEKENNIGSDILIEKIKSGIEKAIKKDYPYCENIRVDIDPVTGKLDIRILKEVMDVMYVDDPDNEIFLDEAKVYDPNIKVGDMVEMQSSAELPLRMQSSLSSTISRILKEQDLSSSITIRSMSAFLPQSRRSSLLLRMLYLLSTRTKFIL